MIRLRRIPCFADGVGFTGRVGFTGVAGLPVPLILKLATAPTFGFRRPPRFTPRRSARTGNAVPPGERS